MTKPRSVAASEVREAPASAIYAKLPEDIPKSEWVTWPRKLEAHLPYSVRARLVTSRLRTGELICYECPDGSVRIPVKMLDDAFGDRASLPRTDVTGKEPTAPSLRAKRLELSDTDLEIDDPVVGMFRECRVMLRDEREHSRLQMKEMREQLAQQLKLLVDPIGAATALLQSTAKSLADRVVFLEERQDAVMAEREMMSDFRHVRDVELETLRGRESRRADLMKLLQKEIGPVLLSKISGGSLADFVAGISPELVDTLIASGMLSARQTAQLQALLVEQRARAAAAAPPPPPAEPNQSNGAVAPQPS